MNHDKIILLVEDDEGHAHLMQKRLRREGIHDGIIHLGDGQQALDFLYAMGTFENQNPPLPDLILLDLNMPVLAGAQVLEVVTQDSRLAHIPVIIMTTSDQPDDIRECEQYGYTDYIIKPPDYPTLAKRIRHLLN